jgi:hypothetical protein
MLAAFWLIASAALAGVAPTAQSATSGLRDSVPQFLAEAAQTSVADLAQALAEAGIPAGFIAFDSDFLVRDRDGEEEERAPTLTRRYRPSPEAPQVPLVDVMAAFKTRYPAYDSEKRDGVLLVRARALGVVRPLEQVRVGRVRLNGVPLGAAFNEAERIVDPTIPVRDGIAGGILLDADQPPPDLEKLIADANPVVRVDIADATLLAVLNDIAKQTPGTVWIVSRHRNARYYTLGYRRPNGGVVRLDDPLR